MADSITARNLFDDLQERLQLRWVSGNEDSDEYSISASDLTARPATAGFLNLIHPNRVQVLGEEEIAFLAEQEAKDLDEMTSRMFSSLPLAIIVGDGLKIPDPVLNGARGTSTVLMCSDLRAHELVNYLQYHISRSLARRTTLHGVFMEVFTIGVLISGGPGLSLIHI